MVSIKKMVLIVLLTPTLCWAKDVTIKSGDNLRAKLATVAGGDTVNIGPGSYKVGYSAGEPGCTNTAAYACATPTIPSGPDKDHPTRILGDCTNPPEIWGTERTPYILSLVGSSNVEIECLELTDHSACTWFGGSAPTRCKRGDDYPYGDQADYGIVAQDSSNVLLKNLNIHGLHIGGVHAARLTDWTVEDTRIVANSFVGWDGDIYGNDQNKGTITFRRTQIQFNGCGETYPGKQPYNCLGQSAGGYGDGLGVGLNSNAHWVFEYVDVSHNTSDGIDLLYDDGTGQVDVSNSTIADNAGNQLKTQMPTHVVNTQLLGGCDYFAKAGKAYAYAVDDCRAYGNTVAFAMNPGTKDLIEGSTITGVGDVLIQTSGNQCDGTESVTVNNTALAPGTEFHSGEPTKIFYNAGATGNSDGPCGSVKFVKNGLPPPPPPPPTCDPNGSCTALPPACGKTTTGLDSCGNVCSRSGPICPATGTWVAVPNVSFIQFIRVSATAAEFKVKTSGQWKTITNVIEIQGTINAGGYFDYRLKRVP